MKNFTVYLAAPWFNPQQKERHDQVLKILDATSTNVRSPYRIFVCPPNADSFTRRKTFKGNLEEIRDADCVVAITDGKDPGTLWEMGYAYARGIPVLGIALTLGNAPFNLMLAEGCHGVVKTLPDAIEKIVEFGETGSFGNAEWEGDIE